MENKILLEEDFSKLPSGNGEPDSDLEVDPLDENTETSTKNEIGWEYNDTDFVNESYEDTEVEPQTKRRKISGSIAALKGRNGFIWSSDKSKENSLLEITTPLLTPKCKGPAISISNPLEAWNLLLDEPILLHIVKHTNEQIRKYREKAPYQRTIDVIELRAWLGLNYLCGLFRNSTYNGPLEELWTLELGNVIFRITMSISRFEFIARCLRFHEAPAKRKRDLNRVVYIWDKFLINCRSYYAASENCRADEHILNTADATCPFQHTIPGNVDSCGIRLVSVYDAKTLYMCNGIIATSSAQSEKDILNLVCDFKGTKRNICVSQSYTTTRLAIKLHKNNLRMVGALSADAEEIPEELLSFQEPQPLFSGALTLLKCDDIPSGFLLSSGLTPEINTKKLYTSTENSSRRFQHLADIYSTCFAAPATELCWPLQFFHTMLDYAAINAWILLRLSDKGDASLPQRGFLRQLGLYLTKQHLVRHLRGNDKLSLAQKLEICEILGEPTDKLILQATATAHRNEGAGSIPTANGHVPADITLLSRLCATRLRCRKCPHQKGCKTRTRCQQCLMPLCNRHLVLRCEACTGVKHEAATSE